MPPTRKAAAAARRSMSRTKDDEKPKGLAARRNRPAGAKPTMVDMSVALDEAIEKAGDAHDGASRPTIKKFIISKFKLEDNATTDGRIATAIRRGNESGVFALPKGFGGKIRIAESGDKPYVKPKTSSKGTKRTTTGSKTSTSFSSTARKPPAKRTTANSTGNARQKQSEGSKKGAAKTNAKRGAASSTRTSSRSTPAKKTASKSSPRKTTSSSSRRARD
ncbi:histone H1/H5 [Rhodotorula toruloides]|uniref:Histone H1 n=1 Tax=Rhodotorula toruloides TaxID=5286 RepID=A0A511K7Q4_RHOTO|nr:histone H1/H5 [Rhodotorula toruloides]